MEVSRTCGQDIEVGACCFWFSCAWRSRAARVRFRSGNIMELREWVCGVARVGITEASVWFGRCLGECACWKYLRGVFSTWT
eukprot:11208898-Alexandrium_andersonii.AAC.1